MAVRYGCAQLRFEFLRVELALSLVLAGNHNVDPIGLVADVLVDPIEFDCERLGREADRAQHAQTTRVRYGCNDVATVGEGKDREFDAEAFADFGTHAGPRAEMRRNAVLNLDRSRQPGSAAGEAIDG